MFFSVTFSHKSQQVMKGIFVLAFVLAFVTTTLAAILPREDEYNRDPTKCELIGFAKGSETCTMNLRITGDCSYYPNGDLDTSSPD
jgi:hypothetical protein